MRAPTPTRCSKSILDNTKVDNGHLIKRCFHKQCDLVCSTNSTNYSFPQNCLWLTLTLHFVLSSYSCCDLFWSCGNGFWVTPPRKFRHPGVFCDGHLRKKLGRILGLLRCESEGIEMAMSGFSICLSIVHPPPQMA